MSASKADIKKELRTHLLNVSGIPSDVNWEGRTFTPPQQSGGNLKAYIRETILPADEIKSANGELMSIGLYRAGK